ncbi:MAG: DPP IV N-terminal domain-containing protein, partial [Nitrospinota bacterium]
VSPDGKEIVFESMRLGIGDIWSIDISGKNYQRLTYEDYSELYPAWSPDGTKISYVANKEGIIDIWIMDRDGKHKKRVTKDILKEAGGVRWVSRFDYSDLFDAGYYHVSWHPDGTKLALTTLEPGKKESYLTILDFEKDISKVIDNLPEEKESLPDYSLIAEKDLTGGGDWDDFGPSFSPDGKTIAFASNRKGSWDIWNISAEGERLKQITEGSTDDLAPVFSPDGKEIAFIRQSSIVNRQYDIWIMKSDGSGAQQVTKDIPVISYPAWNPQRDEIAFIAKGDAGPEINMIDLKTSTVRSVISIWDKEKPNPLMFPFAEEVGREEFNPQKIIKMKKLFQEGKVERAELLTFKKIFEIPYPLEEFLYKIDYNTKGDKLIFESNQTGTVNIWSVNRDGAELTHITRGDGTYLNPVFSPDNKKIAYARKLLRKLEFGFNTRESYDIWIADTVTSEEIPINDEEQTDWNPVFSPDGKKIAYVTNRSGDFEHYNIWMLYLK